MAEQQLVLLKEKVSIVDDLDKLKFNLNQVSVEHNEDRIKLSSHLKDAIGKEKNKWVNDLMELKVSWFIFFQM